MSVGAEFVGVEPAGEERPLIPPPEMPFRTIKHRWTGTDGSVWDLSDPDTGVFLIQDGIDGLHVPPATLVRRESPNFGGSSYQGYKLDNRSVVWPVYIYSDESSEAYFDLDRRFWRSLKIGSEGVWRVTKPDGSWRELTMRIEPNPLPIDFDPGRFGWFKYAVTATADTEPCWRGPAETPGSKVTFADKVGKNFFGGDAGKGPPFFITASASTRIKDYDNDGDEDVWPTIIITGPMNYVDITIGSKAFHVDCKLTDSTQWFKIVTNPRFLAFTDDKGANRIADVSSYFWPSLPARKKTTIQVTPNGDGGGTVMLDAPRLYHRAW